MRVSASSRAANSCTLSSGFGGGVLGAKLCESQSYFSRDVSCFNLTPGRPKSMQVDAKLPDWTGRAEPSQDCP